jgi:hypothetical protein
MPQSHTEVADIVADHCQAEKQTSKSPTNDLLSHCAAISPERRVVSHSPRPRGAVLGMRVPSSQAFYEGVHVEWGICKLVAEFLDL